MSSGQIEIEAGLRHARAAAAVFGVLQGVHDGRSTPCARPGRGVGEPSLAPPRTVRSMCCSTFMRLATGPACPAQEGGRPDGRWCPELGLSDIRRAIRRLLSHERQRLVPPWQAALPYLSSDLDSDDARSGDSQVSTRSRVLFHEAGGLRGSRGSPKHVATSSAETGPRTGPHTACSLIGAAGSLCDFRRSMGGTARACAWALLEASG